MELPEASRGEIAAQKAAEMVGNSTLELSEDKSFKLDMMLAFEGTYEHDGDMVQLTVTKAMGMELKDMPASGSEIRTMSFKVSDGGKTLTEVPHPDRTDKGIMVFKRT